MPLVSAFVNLERTPGVTVQSRADFSAGQGSIYFQYSCQKARSSLLQDTVLNREGDLLNALATTLDHGQAQRGNDLLFLRNYLSKYIMPSQQGS